MKKVSVIAIDGISGSGKSSSAKTISERLNSRFIDTGAMYRAVTYYCLVKRISIQNQEGVIKLTRDLEFEVVNKNLLLVNGEDLEGKIRTSEVSANVSDYCQIPEVREYLVEAQRKLGLESPSVVDGRDIGTVVFPNAVYKFFFWASPEVRAKRRFSELESNGLPADYQEILKNLQERDHKDTSRTISPLIKAEDAIVIDTSDTSFEEQIELVLGKVDAKFFFTPSESGLMA